METDKAISINFTDLQDTPDSITSYPNCILSSDGDKLIFTSQLKVSGIVNSGNEVIQGDLKVYGNTNLQNQVSCDKLTSKNLYVSQDTILEGFLKVNGDISNQALQTKGCEAIMNTLNVSQSVKSQNIESLKVKSMDMETDKLIIHKDLRLPQEVNVSSLNVNTLKVLETSYLNKVLSTDHTSVSLNSNSGLITDLTSVNALVVDMKATKIESDEIVASSIYHKTIDIDGSPDIPDMKDPDGGYFQRSITSSKYTWYGKLKVSSNSIKFKLNTKTPNVLSQVIPRISFHAYSLGSFDLKPSFKYDTQIFPNQNDDASFFVNVNFSDNLPLVAKFIFSVVLEKV